MVNRTRELLALAIVIGILFSIAVAALAHSEIPVLTTSAREQQPAAAPGYLLWGQNSSARPKHYDVFIRPDAGTATKMNRAGSLGWSPGISGTTAIYQEVISGSSDLVFYDAITGTRSEPPSGVNTKYWEWRPSASGDWILFSRRNFSRHDWEKIILFNTSTHQSITIDQDDSVEPYLAGGQVSGNFAVWTHCTKKCNVYRYDIDSGDTISIPNPVTYQYDPAVTADGTVYYVRAGHHCGQAVRMIRRDPGGTETTILTLPSGKEAWYNSATTNIDASASLYYSRVSCKQGVPSDIYRIDDADTSRAAAATPPKWREDGGRETAPGHFLAGSDSHP